MLQENDRLSAELTLKTVRVSELESQLRIKDKVVDQAVAWRNSTRIENIELKAENKMLKQQLAALATSTNSTFSTHSLRQVSQDDEHLPATQTFIIN